MCFLQLVNISAHTYLWFLKLSYCILGFKSYMLIAYEKYQDLRIYLLYHQLLINLVLWAMCNNATKLKHRSVNKIN